MSSAVFPETAHGHEHWTYRCPPAPDGCGYRTFAYCPTRKDAERLYADHRTTHPIPLTQEPTHPTTPGEPA